MKDVILKFDIVEPNKYAIKKDWEEICVKCKRLVKKKDTLGIDTGIYCRECVTKILEEYKLKGWTIDWKNLVYWETISREEYEKEFSNIRDPSIYFGKLFYCLNCGVENSIYMTEYCVECGESLDIANNTYGKLIVKKEEDHLIVIDGHFGNE